MGKPVSEVRLRVRYAETDQMGFAYYGCYAAWLEVGRVEYLRERGLAYRDIEAEGSFLAVRRLEVDYLAPARYDDEIAVRTRVAGAGKSRVDFESEIVRAAGGEVLSATGLLWEAVSPEPALGQAGEKVESDRADGRRSGYDRVAPLKS